MRDNSDFDIKYANLLKGKTENHLKKFPMNKEILPRDIPEGVIIKNKRKFVIENKRNPFKNLKQLEESELRIDANRDLEEADKELKEAGELKMQGNIVEGFVLGGLGKTIGGLGLKAAGADDQFVDCALNPEKCKDPCEENPTSFACLGFDQTPAPTTAAPQTSETSVSAEAVTQAPTQPVITRKPDTRREGWSNLSWRKLNEQERNTAISMGYNQASWDRSTGNSTNPPRNESNNLGMVLGITGGIVFLLLIAFMASSSGNNNNNNYDRY